MKTNLKFFLVVLGTVFIFACSDDDNSESQEDPITQTDDDPDTEPQPSAEEVLNQERTTAISTLTADGEKVWRIANAVLTNSNGSFEITSGFNVVDDEFKFSNTALPSSKNTEFEGTLQWNPGFAFDIEASDAQDAITELYANAEVTAFDFNDDSGNQITAFEGDLMLQLSDGNLSGMWDFGEGTTLDVTLVPKLDSDYAQVPTSGLEFTEVFTIESNGISGFAPGMVGSLSTNSFYFATRESAFSDGTTNPERVVKFDLSTGQKTEYLNFTADFVTKQLNIIDDRLVVAGGQRITSYPLDLDAPPTSLPDYSTLLSGATIGLSRFGTAVLGNQIYLVGGDLNGIFADKIFIYDIVEQTMNEFATMPERRTGARAEIINDKLYIFGGTEEFLAPPAKDTIYIFDLHTGELTIESLPEPVLLTYTGKFENLIFVGGWNETRNSEGILTDREPFLGIYDTRTGDFTILATNLDSPEFEVIESMAVFNGKVYVIFGQGEEMTPGELQTWSIFEASF